MGKPPALRTLDHPCRLRFRRIPACGVQGVLDSVEHGAADIGFLAYDAGRALEVDFSRPYAIGQNTFVVTDYSPVKSVAELNAPGLVANAIERAGLVGVDVAPARP